MFTKDQIEYLFAFCRKHSVHYYDVQVELVDHLANAVEHEMQNDSKITFEKAVEKVHRSFGFSGFAPLVAEKMKLTKKQNKRLFWSLFKSQFEWPKILAFFILTFTFASILSHEVINIKHFIFLIFCAGAITLSFACLRFHYFAKKTEKKFLLIDFSHVTWLLFLPLNLVNIIGFSHAISVISKVPVTILIPCVSVFMSLYIIVFAAAMQTLSALKKTLYKTYPEVFKLAE
ncbi:MAG: hypothetical protein M3015_00410 [Bacteroidota bacterium]|nr:hypothetical protein [Bacteroidota bacterium]